MNVRTKRSDQNKSILNQTENGSAVNRLINTSSDSNDTTQKETIIFKFGTVVILLVTMMLLKSYFFCRFAFNASESIHSRVFSRVMMTSLQIFGAESSGMFKIINHNQ